MRTTVTIVGVGERRTGKSKNGKAYDFVDVAFTYPDRNMEGVNAGCCALDGAEFERSSLSPGLVVDAIILERHFRPYIAAIL